MSEDFIEDQASLVNYDGYDIEQVRAALSLVTERLSGTSGTEREALEGAKQVLFRAQQMLAVTTAVYDALESVPADA